MTTEGQGQGPLNDPRLIERRGDLSGLNAALFVILVIVAFAAAAYLLATILHIGGAGTSPSASPSAPIASPSLSTTAIPSTRPSPLLTPSLGPSPSSAATAALRQPVTVVVGGRSLGTVTVISVQYPKTVGGKTAGSSLRWVAARIRYDATADLPYDNGDWTIVDANGKQYAWAGVDFKPPLGQGTVSGGERFSGNVTFKVPLHATLWLVFSGGELRIQMPAQ